MTVPCPVRRTAIAALLEDLNQRPFKRLPGSRASQYATLDRPALKPLPVSRYELARYVTEPPPEAAKRLKSLKIPKPPPILQVACPT